MDLHKLIEDYVSTRLTIGGCILKLLVALFALIGIPIMVVQAVEKLLKDLDITWPMYLMIVLLAATIIVGVVVYMRSNVNPGLNVAIVMAGGSAAFTAATVMVFVYYDVKWMGILFAALALDGWWMTYRCFFPRKKKEEKEEAKERKQE